MRLKATLILCLCTLLLSAQQKPSQQWLDQKFSMFIHFGLYSAYGGVYEGKPVTRGYSEQIQSFAGIFSDWYARTTKEFNPVQWNPGSIVSLAKEAGMQSIVFTSKHHDGFCMYHSDYTDFNIVDATPYGRDLMKELAEACKKGGIGFGVYYSLIDWHYPQAFPISSHNADPLTPEHYAYNLKQVEEIMTRYGDISEIWFDMGSLTPEQSKGLYELVNRLQPQCMVSGRLGNDFVDFAVMADNEYPDYQLGVPWQTAASMFDETWGYRSWQDRGSVEEKVNEKIASLIRVVGTGGHYLLNIGPRGDGSVVEFERDVLRGIGAWLKVNPLNLSSSWKDDPEKASYLPAEVSQSVVGSGALSPQNATPLFGHSSLNYYAGYKSIIGYEWVLPAGTRKVTPEITFTDSETGRRIVLEIDGHKQPVTLQSASFKTERLPSNSVIWSKVFRKPGRGVFGNVEEEGAASVDLNTMGSEWELVDNFQEGVIYTEDIQPRESVIFLHEIVSSRQQTASVEITCGNGVYILLNGEYLTAHLSPARIKEQKELLLLPLKKGLNQLIIKYYNGFDETFSYGVNPLSAWKIYSQKLTPVTLDKKEEHAVWLRSGDAISPVSPLRLNNVKIQTE
ncbi:MAG: alpha-L-fucosidase [Proteiniphilum sp.]